MGAGLALPVPCPAPPDRDLQLGHRLQPVDVRALEQPDLDESHDPGRIARGPPDRLARMDRVDASGPAVSRDELELLQRLVVDIRPAYLEDLATLVNSDSGSYT